MASDNLYNGTCKKCGCKAYIGLVKVECSNKSCPLYKEPPVVAEDKKDQSDKSLPPSYDGSKTEYVDYPPDCGGPGPGWHTGSPPRDPNDPASLSDMDMA